MSRSLGRRIASRYVESVMLTPFRAVTFLATSDLVIKPHVEPIVPGPRHDSFGGRPALGWATIMRSGRQSESRFITLQVQ